MAGISSLTGPCYHQRSHSSGIPLTGQVSFLSSAFRMQEACERRHQGPSQYITVLELERSGDHAQYLRRLALALNSHWCCSRLIAQPHLEMCTASGNPNDARLCVKILGIPDWRSSIWSYNTLSQFLFTMRPCMVSSSLCYIVPTSAVSGSLNTVCETNSWRCKGSKLPKSYSIYPQPKQPL